MSDRAPAARADLTPNQLAKQQQIVEAAMRVLAEDGLAACTARQIATVAPLTRSAIHYYFADIDVLIDRAMSQHVENFAALLRGADTGDTDREAAFWATVTRYLDTFRDQPRVTYLWFEYWLDAVRKGRTDAVDEMNGRVVEVLAARLDAAGVARAETTARDVFVLLLGEVLTQGTSLATTDRVRAYDRVSAVTGLRPPSPRRH